MFINGINTTRKNQGFIEILYYDPEKWNLRSEKNNKRDIYQANIKKHLIDIRNVLHILQEPIYIIYIYTLLSGILIYVVKRILINSNYGWLLIMYIWAICWNRRFIEIMSCPEGRFYGKDRSFLDFLALVFYFFCKSP